MTIFLLNKEVDLDKSELLLSLPFADASDLEQLELASGSWGIENGALVGRFRGNGGGICYTKDRFPGDILIDFYGTMLSPCNNDLNFVLKAEGWDYERNDAARGFIGGPDLRNTRSATRRRSYPLQQCLTASITFRPVIARTRCSLRSMASCWSKCATRPRRNLPDLAGSDSGPIVRRSASAI